MMNRKNTAVLLLLAALVCLVACQKPDDGNGVVAYINGEAISSREMDYFRTRDRSDIINQYAEQYGITDFSDFWDKDFDGTTPDQALSQKALDDACDAKIRLCLMRDYGIYEDISFDAREAKAKAYNEAHQDQKNVVGLNSIDMSQFYTYYISTGEMTLKTMLAEDKLQPTEAEIQAYLAGNGGMSEQSAASALVSEKYEAYISELLAEADIRTTEA